MVLPRPLITYRLNRYQTKPGDDELRKNHVESRIQGDTLSQLWEEWNSAQ